jgi:hypothetical protein
MTCVWSFPLAFNAAFTPDAVAAAAGKAVFKTGILRPDFGHKDWTPLVQHAGTT